MRSEAVQQYLNRHGFEALSLKAVLFDMDGVLFDSMPTHAKAWYKTAVHFSLPLTEKEAYEHEGRTAKSTLDLLFQRKEQRNATPEEVKTIYDYKIQIYNSYNLETHPMPGAPALLQKVRQDGYQTILVTGSGQDTLTSRLQRFYPDIFHKDTMVTGKSVKQGKPSPEPYLLGLKVGQLHPWEAIVVENAPLGVRSAVSAGIFTIAVNTGPMDDSILLAEHPNMLLHSMEELNEKWEEIARSFC